MSKNKDNRKQKANKVGNFLYSSNTNSKLNVVYIKEEDFKNSYNLIRNEY